MAVSQVAFPLDAYAGNEPAFIRIKKVDAPPAFSFKIDGYEFGNLAGIPVTVDGWVIATARYSFHFECDVCGEEVHEEKLLGNSVQVRRDEAQELEKQLHCEVPFHDKELLQHPEKHFFFSKYYLFQCSRCGRWVGKGAKHQHCRDDEYGLCKYCGNTMHALLDRAKLI